MLNGNEYSVISANLTKFVTVLSDFLYYVMVLSVKTIFVVVE